MSKKISFGKRPSQPDPPNDLDQWVAAREEPSNDPPPVAPPEPEPAPVKMKRLTLDIPEPLHRQIKLQATQQGKTMVEVLREILDREFGQEGS